MVVSLCKSGSPGTNISFPLVLYCGSTYLTEQGLSEGGAAAGGEIDNSSPVCLPNAPQARRP